MGRRALSALLSCPQYAHDGTFNELFDCGIPGPIFKFKPRIVLKNVTFYSTLFPGFFIIAFFWTIFFMCFRTSPLKITVSALTSVIFLGSFSNMTRTFSIQRYRTSMIMEVLPRYIMRIMEHLVVIFDIKKNWSTLAILNSYFYAK